MQSSVVPFGDNTFPIKQTHHHYCGFYSVQVLATIINNVVVVNGKQYNVSDETAIDWAFDGEDTIVTEKRLLYTDEELPLHAPIYNIDHQLVGIVLAGMQTTDGDYCYAIQDGFKSLNIHLSNMNLVVREKRKMACYADQQFDTKQELVDYINNRRRIDEMGDSDHGAILYHVNKKNAQLVVFQNGLQVINCHLRKKVFGVL
ncbi:hypothetical protein [Erinnyis ello granulovirus]|uniref:Uncharacterized protein n=1 Tax=Erinnyis ello granulovirus TaxID=307444 RepID=A0A097DAN9_9BBAC|nr:hypothetical protein [Erinnyis ello granulovirus]AIS92057.1 hypothetical protein [Erinnyis ello granulovirus]ARX71397.1 hypothetical protein EREL_058 [Erinnyis ello granulovirus]ARX71527.1 hypothetical protein EREL_058 [Erinnyis ello granulovirus]ARX71657.1 hypothetical protein EREL_058 [Erinnyis ello granulovirus]ARX71787.1 hypothetical protein EREL_058 [Erinnyis ello granulovirus]